MPAKANIPADKRSATDKITAAITQAIVERRLLPGTKLPEQKIADIFSVSRTLVRQALNQLSRDRLVSLTPARGAFVAEPSAAEARQVFEARQMLEGALLERLALSIDSAQIAELRRHLRAERAALKRADVPERIRQLADFHALLARLHGNAVLAQLLSDLLSRSSLVALMYQSAHSAAESQAEHGAIVDALEQRDVKTAMRLMAHHLGNVEANLTEKTGGQDLVSALMP